MRVLIDTHTFIWLVAMTTRLRPSTRALLADPANTVLLSAVSAWEIAIKYGTGRLALPTVPSLYIPSRVERHGLTPLAIEHRHAVAVAELPAVHKDPFDRLLVAQAIVEGVPLITADGKLRSYPVQIIPA